MKETIVMNPETLDDESAVINFDVVDSETHEVTQTGGYVMTRHIPENNCFTVTVINHNGDVLSEVNVPCIFNKSNDENIDIDLDGGLSAINEQTKE